MAKKLDSIVELAAQTARQITANSGNYMAFLTTAAHNFKYSFRDQLLIFAQKPEATACAQIDFWNSRGRWVNRGTTGIALLVDTDRGYRLRHVFDMSDTNSREGRTVPVWQMKPEYESAVIEGLENSYGELSGKPNLAACLMETAKIIVEDNFSDYYADLCSVKAGSLLEELDEDSTRAWFKNLLENSVAFMLLTRCGMDAGEHFTREDFAHVFEFNTPETLSILGAATRDISEMALREIATTVLSLYREELRQNRTFAQRPDSRYNDGRTKSERNGEHGTDIPDRGRLPSAQPGRAGGTQGRKIWDAAAQLPPQEPERDLHRADAGREAGQPSGGDRPAGHRDGGQPDGAHGGGAGRGRSPESVRPDEVGGADEQHPGVGGGNGADGVGVRLTDPLPSEEEQRQAIQKAEDEKSSAFSVSQEDIDAVLLHGSGIEDGKFRIYERFQTVGNPGKNTTFLKEEYGSATYFPVITDKKLNVWSDPSGMKIAIGELSAPVAEIKLTWKKAAKRISQLVEAGRYLSPAEQEQYPEYQRKHDDRAARVTVSEKFWSIIKDYNDYQTQLDQTDKCLEGYPLALCRTAFATGQKKMYQTIEGQYILPLMRKALQAIIGEGTHLTERCEAVLADLNGPLAAPLEPTDEELNPPPKEYDLSLGDKVYLGAQEYELLAFDKQNVRLYDPSFPLINKELPRAEFDRLLAESPMNNHLLKTAEPPQAVGRLDFLSADGTVYERTEYTDAERFIAEIKEKNSAGAPIRIVFYRDNEGQTIPVDFAMKLNPPIQGFRVIDYAERHRKETPGYDLGYAHMGNGLTVWNRLEEEHGDYKTIAHISPDRTVKFYVDDLPEDVRAQIEHIAATSEATISATQDAPVFSTPPLGREPVSGSFWDDYNSIKEHNPDSLVLYQVGDFFELYGGLAGEDAHSAARVLNLLLTTRAIPDVGRVSMCGFPVHKLEECVDRLTGAGFDVIVAALENNRHTVQPIPVPATEPQYEIRDTPYIFCEWSESDAFQGKTAYSLSEFDRLMKQADNEYTAKSAAAMEKYGTWQKWYDADDPEFRVYLGYDKVMFTIVMPDGRTFTERQDVGDGDGGVLDFLSKYNAYRKIVPVLREAVRQEIGDPKAQPESDDFSDIDPAAVRAALAGRGIVDGQVVDPDKLNADPFIQQVMADVAQIAAEAPPPQEPAEKEETPGTKNIASYQSGDERIVISRYHNGKYYNRYGYDEQRDFATTTAGGFDTFEEAEQTLFSHRPNAEKILEPAEKEATPKKEPLASPAPQRRAKVSPFVLHPEIPTAERNEYHITNDSIGVGTPGERFKNNIRAIRLLKKLESEDRFATPEEQAILAQYVGWGGLADCFDERHSKYAELKALLTEDEYEAARESTLTAFYTPPVVIRSIYQALEAMGFKTGNMLEPSCGVGNFIGMRPDDLADAKIYGIEIDSLSGRIAQQLYQKSSIAVQGFEKTDLPDSFFEAAIGNVPFGAFKVSDKRYNKHNFLIHDYFFARTLDKVRPGGIIAFVTSKGTMDKENPSVRKYIAQRANLLGAIRLPNNTFKAAAGTEVTSDILFLQKRDTLTCEEPAWVHLNTDENGLKMNQYFIDNPEMVLGEMKEVSGPFGPETACLPMEGQDLGEQLAAAIQNIQGSITEYVMDDPEAEEEDRSIPADPEVRNFSYTVVDGQVYYRENSRMNPVEVSVTAENRIKGLIEIRDCVRTLIEYQTDDWPDEDIQAAQKKLNTLYDAFVKKYGRINSRGNSAAFRMDSAYFLLSSLEVLDDERNFVRKADMFTKRTIKQKVVVTSVSTASEALAVSLAEKACVDLGYMADLMGGGDKIPQVVEDLKGVIFKDPLTGSFDIEGDAVDWYKGWQTADEYLSGDVREKLAEAKLAAQSDPAFQVNVEALEQVQPTDLTASEISVRLGSTWLPPEVVEQFVFELLDTLPFAREKIHVHYSKYAGIWNVEGKSADKENVKANSTYGTERINAYKIIEDTLNLRDVRIFDYSVDSAGKRIATLNKQETAIAQGKQEIIRQEFRDWVWKDPERRMELTQLYNVEFNSNRPREYDGSHLNFVGMNPEITLREHQRNAIAHILYGGNTLLGHVVGAGKTWEMVAAAQESKRLGLCQKSLFVVPNHLTEQWATEYLQLYPSANILVATKKDFETKNRKRFCGRIATGDYDAIIIGHSQLEKIPMSAERQRYILEQQRKEVMDGIAELKAQNGDRFSVKQLEKTRMDITDKLANLNDQSRKDNVVTFEELGVDRLFIDEAHYYKNLASFSKMRNVGGIAQTEAKKSSDLYMKCRYLDEITGGRGVIFATGTPISNTMVEMFTMQKYLQYNTLKRRGLLHFDSWASTFGETITAIELAPEGSGYRSKTRFARFHNLPELMAMFKEVADIKTADQLNLPVPKANYHPITLKPSNLQEEMVEGLSERAERIRNRMVRSNEDNMLLVTNDGRKLALDQRLLNPLLPDSDTSKTNACADNVFEIWQRTADQRSAQMIFCDLSTPGTHQPIEMTPNDEGVFEMAAFQNVYDDLRDKLIARGIPAEEIAFVHSANTETKKKELFGKVRSGQIRVLLGSTQRMGAGTNAQNKLIALHHLDCPWRPSDLQQREGRIIRQGNENDEVEIYTYVTENTFDSYLYQMVENKQKFIGQIMTSKSPVRSAEDIDETALSYAEIKALCTGDDRIKEKMDLDIDVQRLKLLKSNHLSQKYSLEDRILRYFPNMIAIVKGQIKKIQEDIAIRDKGTQPNEDGFSPMEIQGKVYTGKKAAGSAILAACKTLTGKANASMPLGHYRGFAMELYFNAWSKAYELTLTGSRTNDVTLGMDLYGNIQRIDNALDYFETALKGEETSLANYEAQLASAKVEVEKPFPQEDELKTKAARLDELNIALNLDKQENEIVDGEIDEDAPPPARDSTDRDR